MAPAMPKTEFTVIIDTCFSQSEQDARMLGMSDAYTTLVTGYNSVGVNPAALADNKFSINSFISFVSDPNLKNATEMSIASNLAGKAISISKTTAPHATSYPFTSLFNISHGHAVSLTLNKLYSNLT